MKRCISKLLVLFAAAILLVGAASDVACAHSGHPGKGRRTLAAIARPAVYRELVCPNGYDCENAPCLQNGVCPNGYDCKNAPCLQDGVCPNGYSCENAPCYQNGVCAQNGACDVDGVCQNGGYCSGIPCYTAPSYDSASSADDIVLTGASCYRNGVCAQNGTCDVNGICQNGGICPNGYDCPNTPCPQDGVCPNGYDCPNTPCPQDGTGYGLHHSETPAGYGSGHHSQRGHRAGHH